jgi:anthranilate/para-aminobenzoate synthase component II
VTLLISQIGNMSSAFVDARQAVAAAAGIQETEVEEVRFHPESFLIRCPNQMVRDHLVAASPIPLGHTNMSLQP